MPKISQIGSIFDPVIWLQFVHEKLLLQYFHTVGWASGRTSGL